MWKKVLRYVSEKRKDTHVEEPTETERGKQFKVSSVETWTYGMTALPLGEVEEGTTNQAIAPKKEKRVVGDRPEEGYHG